MEQVWRRVRSLFEEFAARLTKRRDREPIATVADLQHFLVTRSAFVAQHTLYGYLKSRMGTRYPAMFADDTFIRSVDIAKAEVFAACLADLTIHAVATVTTGQGVGDPARGGLAAGLYEAGLSQCRDDLPQGAETAVWLERFAERLGETDWEAASCGDAFTASPDALVRWAPIADDLKRHDTEIMRNSVRYAWIDVTRSLKARLDASALMAEIREQRH